jgi:hypothetical protein
VRGTASDHPPEHAANPPARATTITGLDDGPLEGSNIEVAVVDARPPKTINVPADDRSACRYCLAGWMPSAAARLRMRA